MSGILEKLRSRKFWITLGVGVVVLFANGLGFEVTEDQVTNLVLLATGYNIAQGYVDAKAIAK